MQMFKLYRMLVVLAVGVTLGSPVWAQGMSRSRGAGWEFGIEAVYLDSKDLDFEGGTTMSVDDDFGLTLIFGYRVNPKLEMQFSFDWAEVDYTAHLESAILPNVSADVRGDLEAFTPRLNVIYNFRDAPVTPYVSAGIGWSFVDTNIPNSRVEVGCWWDPWYGQICTPYQSTKSVDAFAYQAGVGVRWDISRYYSLRFGYQKQWYDYSNATSTPDFDEIRLGFQWNY